MDIDITELEEHKNELKGKLYDAKRNREKLNKLTNELKQTKSSLLDRINKYRKDGSLHRERRDEINRNVARAKKHRSELNEEYEKIKQQIDELRKTYFPNGLPLDVLKQRRDTLEFKQMTHQLSKREEAEIIEQLSSINKEIKEREDKLKNNAELMQLIKKEHSLKQKGDKEHHKVTEYADKAQKEHFEMLECFKNASELQKELRKVEKDYILNRLDADKAHP